MDTPPTEHRERAADRRAMLLLAALGAMAALVFSFAAAQRVPYPYDLEWMEGAMVDAAARVARGLPTYCAPGPDYVPFLYAPLPFWLGGVGIAIGVDGRLALRLVSVIATVLTALCIGHWVRRETGDRRLGLIASGLYFAGYGWLAWWYDLARNDALFVAACTASAYVLRHGGARRWLWAAVLATTALLAKQTALMWLPVLGVGAFAVDWRNALRFCGAAAAFSGIGIAILHLASDGWSTFYLFEMPRHHLVDGSRWTGFWTGDIAPMLPMVLAMAWGGWERWRRGDRDGVYPVAFACGGILASWASRLHVGGFDNVMMYAFAGGCVAGPIGVGAIRSRWIGPGLLLAEFALLGPAAFARDPAHSLLPSPAHRQAQEQLSAFVAAQAGPVWLPGHGGMVRGRGSGAHGQAVFDLLQLLPRLSDGTLDLTALDPGQGMESPDPNRQVLAGFMAAATNAIRERRYAAIVVDEIGTAAFLQVFAIGLAGADRLPGTADDPYVPRPAPLLSDPSAIRPLLGFDVRAPFALVPR